MSGFFTCVGGMVVNVLSQANPCKDQRLLDAPPAGAPFVNVCPEHELNSKQIDARVSLKSVNMLYSSVGGFIEGINPFTYLHLPNLYRFVS